MARAGRSLRTATRLTQLPALYFPCGCDLTARMPSCQGGPCERPPSGCDSRQPHQFLWRHVRFSLQCTPNSNRPRTSSCSRVSKTQLAWGSTRAACQFSWGRGRQVMHLPCKQAHAGALPADSTISLRGESDSGEAHNLSFRGCNSRPRYHLFEGDDPVARL